MLRLHGNGLCDLSLFWSAKGLEVQVHHHISRGGWNDVISIYAQCQILLVYMSTSSDCTLLKAL
jgi:hypothetical protein